ncbi:MAG: polyprenyl synthetase family protein [Smithellaceae bacterium]|nr:polyprenyl synthetase family protein [Smithellaceae bacterium]
MKIQDVFHKYGDGLQRVEMYMTSHLHSEVKLIPEVVNHLIGSGGKRFRPLLLLVAADLCGYRGDRCYRLASVIEFIHTATLLHDDVVDGASTRRGRDSANHVWGNAASVLVGDFLYSQAFNLLADDGNMAIMKLLATSTGSMSEGEVFQLIKCGDTGLTEKEYLSIIEKKTSILISAACAIGGILGSRSESEIQSLTRFGMRLGSAFQITDDILDYAAEEEEFGKAIGKDLQEGKITLPLIHTLKKCSPRERKLLKEILTGKEPDISRTGEIMALVERYNGILYASQKAAAHIEEAKELLHAFPDSPARTALFAISDYVLSRRL